MPIFYLNKPLRLPVAASIKHKLSIWSALWFCSLRMNFSNECKSVTKIISVIVLQLYLFIIFITKKEPIARLTGHQQLNSDVNFSLDMRHIASASFDKSIRSWDGKNGKFIAAARVNSIVNYYSAQLP